MRLRALLRLAAAVAGFGVLAACSGGVRQVATVSTPSRPDSAAASTPATTCPATRGVSALVPASGVLYGVNLDWGHDSVAGYAKRLGRTPAVAVDFATFPLGDSARDVDRAVDQAAAARAALMLTLQPTGGLATVTSAAAHALAVRLAGYNARGVAVYLRFAHEMNGTWYAWGQQPTAYIAAFRTVAAAVHKTAPLTAMVWAPNYGGGYPFAGGPYLARPGSRDFAMLDTNHDGRLTQADDPYTPYYPGDDAVDWIGVSIYHWGAHYPWGHNDLPEPGAFVAMLRGTYHGTVGDQRAVPDLYGFAVAHHRPLAVTETAAFYSPGHGGNALTIKQDWWGQVFAAVSSGALPQLRMVNWFEWDKYETEVHDRVDWTTTKDATQAAAFRAALPPQLRYAGSLSLCD